jgi:hypothetical protein
MNEWKDVKRWEAEIKAGDAIAIIWCKDDVLHQAGEIEITDEQAKDILRKLKRYHDAEYGVCWDTIQFHIDNLKGEE